jgi:predicted ATP-grasp superfamily ATP-dependent carboligase
LDAHLKSALAAIRSLGSRGIRVVAGADRRTAMGLHSKHVWKGFIYPSPYQNGKRFLDAIWREAEASRQPMVLYSFSDATFLPLYENRSRFEHLLSSYPEAESSVTIAFSKVATLKLAMRTGIETPPTHFLRNLSEVDEFAQAWRYPLVIKPCHSTSWHRGFALRLDPQFVFSVEEARGACEQMAQASGALPIMQEYLAGEELGVEFLCEKGEVLAAFAHRRLRSLSPVGGASVVKEAIPESYKSVGPHARRLIRELRWSGPAMIEFKVDDRDGRAKMMEINGRFWGSLPLAVVAGVDFPWLYFCQVTGQEMPAMTQYQEGIVSRHWLGDLANLAQVLLSRNPMRPLSFPKRSTALREFLFPGHAAQPDVARVDDLVPAGAELLDALRRVGKRLARQIYPRPR